MCQCDNRLQLITGHEAIGVVVEMGKNVKGFSMGDRCVADVGITVCIRFFLTSFV
jgi:D-arabinitol dehydrogenase (NADP+)